jgi:hypothetical protein
MTYFIIAVLILAGLITWKAQWVQDLFTNAYDLLHEPERMKRSARIAGSVALVGALGLLIFGGNIANTRVGADHEAFDVVLYLRLALARLFMVAAVWPLVVFGSYATWHWLDNKVGKRLWVWTNDTSDEIKAAKKRNGAVVLAALLVALALLAAGVIR